MAAAATICDSTVAMAAPRMPMPGTGPKPKMNSGSRPTLMSMPRMVMPLALRGLPAAMSALLPSMLSPAVMQPKYHTSMYWRICARVSPSAPRAAKSHLALPMPMTASSRAVMLTRSRPALTSRAACLPSLRPSAWAMVAMMPPPMPWKMQPTSMTAGKVKPMAANGASPPRRPTKKVSAML